MYYADVDYQSARKSPDENWMQYSNRRIQESLPFYLEPFSEELSHQAIFALSSLAYHGSAEHGIPRCRNNNGLRLLFIILVFIRNKIAITPERFIEIYRTTHCYGEKVVWNKSKELLDLADELAEVVAPRQKLRLDIDAPTICDKQSRQKKKARKESYFNWY
jgi:hypothetical protein